MQACLKTERLTEEDEINVARSRIYQLLSLGFSFPSNALQQAQTELWALAATLYPDLELDSAAVEMTSAAMETEYINVFDGHEQKQYCKPYEGLWKESDRAMRQWEVKRFYRFFGLAPSEQTNEMPDHVASELEFMHFLASRVVSVGQAPGVSDVSADANQAEHYLQAQKDFLERHLGQWMPEFCERVQEKSGQPFYRQLAMLTARFVVDDLEWLQEQCGNPPA